MSDRDFPELPFQIERFIVKRLACDVDPGEVAEDIQSQFLRDVDPSTVRAYSPEAEDSALTPDLRDLYQVTRWEYTGAAEDGAPSRSS